MDPNQHVKNFLSYYIGITSPPGFAVLLNGAWGIGKTYLVKEYLKTLERSTEDGFRYVYVSLYGLTSFEEVDDALFRAMYPVFENRGVRIAGRAAKILGKYCRFEIDLLTKEIFKKPSADLFIFDDLERCDIPVNRLLGYINEFVEQDGRKVIIIANENEIKGDGNYRRVREKLVGKTLELVSVFDQALNAFTASVQDHQAQQFLRLKKDVIKEIYFQAELHNLRILQQTTWDFERFYAALDQKHKINEQAMTSLLRLLFALSFEIKAGRLGKKDLLERQYKLLTSLIRSREENSVPTPIELAQSRYPQIDLGTTILSDETLVNVLVKGLITAEQIYSELDSSSFFITVADEPAWRTVWHAYERTEQQFQAALDEMERAFKAREYSITGEIRHILGLRLWLSKINAIPISLKEVVQEGKVYINDLYHQKKIELPDLNERFFARSSYGGLCTFEESTLEYQDLYQYLTSRQQQAAIDNYPTVADEIFKDMINDPEVFLNRITLTNKGDNDWYDIPILASIDPNKFAGAFLDQHPANQRTILYALEARYRRGFLDNKLAKERDWVRTIKELIHTATKTMSPITKHRIRELLRETIDNVASIDPKEDVS